MQNTFKIIKFELNDILRSKWVIIYGILLIIICQLLLQFDQDNSKVILSLLNITLVLNPIITLVFSTVYLFNSREFIELVLSQPVKRSEIFWGLYLGISLPLVLIFVAGVGMPLIIHRFEDIPVLILLLTSGSLLIFMFSALAMGISSFFDDKAMGLGVSILIWLFFAIVFDGIVLIMSFIFSDYPLEIPLIISSILNPMDLARIMIMLKLDVAALMGYTGAVFEKFFGDRLGYVISFSALIVWVTIPLGISYFLFRKKDF